MHTNVANVSGTIQGHNVREKASRKAKTRKAEAKERTKVRFEGFDLQSDNGRSVWEVRSLTRKPPK